MLFAKDAGLAFNPLWEPGRAIRLGEAMASLTPPPPART
jgi:hypothetical protein